MKTPDTTLPMKTHEITDVTFDPDNIILEINHSPTKTFLRIKGFNDEAKREIVRRLKGRRFTEPSEPFGTIATEPKVLLGETISTYKAIKLLANNHERQRNCSWSRVKYTISEIESGRWNLTHQGAAVDVTGKLIDGQKRIIAALLTGTPIQIDLKIGCAEDSIEYVDQNIQVRRVDEVAAMSGNNVYDPRMPPSGVTRGAITNLIGEAYQKRDYSAKDYSEMVAVYYNDLIALGGFYRLTKKPNSSPIKKGGSALLAAFLLMHRFYPKQVEAAIGEYMDNNMQGENHPLMRLHGYLMSTAGKNEGGKSEGKIEDLRSRNPSLRQKATVINRVIDVLWHFAHGLQLTRKPDDQKGEDILLKHFQARANIGNPDFVPEPPQLELRQAADSRRRYPPDNRHEKLIARMLRRGNLISQEYRRYFVVTEVQQNYILCRELEIKDSAYVYKEEEKFRFDELKPPSWTVVASFIYDGAAVVYTISGKPDQDVTLMMNEPVTGTRLAYKSNQSRKWATWLSVLTHYRPMELSAGVFN